MGRKRIARRAPRPPAPPARPRSCHTCAGGLHPTSPCPNRDFDADVPDCPAGMSWTPTGYLAMSGIEVTPEYVAEVIRQWRASKEAQ